MPLEGLVEDAINSDPDVLYNLAMVDHVTSVLRADTPLTEIIIAAKRVVIFI